MYSRTLATPQKIINLRAVLESPRSAASLQHFGSFQQQQIRECLCAQANILLRRRRSLTIHVTSRGPRCLTEQEASWLRDAPARLSWRNFEATEFYVYFLIT